MKSYLVDLLYWTLITLSTDVRATTEEIPITTGSQSEKACDLGPITPPSHAAGYADLSPLEHTTDSCPMYGICDQESGLPCQQTQKQPTLFPYTNSFGRFCQDVLGEISDYNYKLCCNDDQTRLLTRMLYMPESLLSKCSSCFTNLARSLCVLTCSPEQSKWMEVMETVDVDENQAVTRINLYISREYATEVFNSCKNVRLVVTGLPMTDHLCGKGENSATCNEEKWFAWIGNPANGLTNFQIDYILGTKPGNNTTPFSDRHFPCNQAPNDHTEKCECDDCPRSCNNWEDSTTEENKVDPTEDYGSGCTHVTITSCWHHSLLLIILYLMTRTSCQILVRNSVVSNTKHISSFHA